jgi:hypothetical protein
VEGVDNEIYELRCFPKHLIGGTFREAAQELYAKGVLLLGLSQTQDNEGTAFALAPLEVVSC